MKKIVFGIFAHPDDEAFGPSGTLYKLARDGVDVHLVLATAGDAGANSGYKDLRATRLAEWHASGALMGATSMHHLGYEDGMLSNSLYLEIAEKIINHIQATTSRYKEPVEIEFITFEPRGISGHIDHIAISYITTYVYLTLCQNSKYKDSLGTLKYFCISNAQAPTTNTSWLYMPAGYNSNEIDEVVDISDVIEQKLAIMQTHASQKEDMNSIIESQKASKTLHKEHFIYYKD